MNFKIQSLLVVALAGFTGCATTVPAQLAETRDAYVTSRNGLASQMSPTELYDAEKSLNRANKEFAENGDTPALRDYTYIALRKIQLADVKARTEADRRTIAEAVKQGVVVRDSQIKKTEAELAAAREQIKEERNVVSKTSGELQAAKELHKSEIERTTQQLEAEKQARKASEDKLAGAMKDLATLAAVKEEARGVVITLNGSVLFASGKYALLETAKTRLDQVAVALKAQSDEKRILVEGHTDSQGSDKTNQPLSFNRANAVREYLVSAGVDAGKIRAVGMSSSRPLVNNSSAENRANNRRVEIIIEPATATSSR